MLYTDCKIVESVLGAKMKKIFFVRLVAFYVIDIMIAFHVHAEQLEIALPNCKTLTTCDCLQPTDSTMPIEIHCPDFTIDAMQFYYTQKTSLRIQCLPPLNWDVFYEKDESHQHLEPVVPGDLFLLQYVKLHPVEELDLSYCNLNASKSNNDLEVLITATRPKILSLRSNIFPTFGLQAQGTRNMHIETLNMENNMLTQIPLDLVGRMERLKHASFNFNHIVSVNGTLPNVNLESLHLGSNKITYISTDAFRGFKRLHTLYLWDNKIARMNRRTLQDLESLRLLELMENSLIRLDADVFSDLRALRSINLEKNQFHDLPTNLFARNKQLESVRLARNTELTELPDRLLADLPNLKNVRLNSCRLNKLHGNLFANSNKIETIDLNKNQLVELPAALFEGLHELRMLNLAGNRIKMIPDGLFRGVHQLTMLDLSENLLTSTEGEIRRLSEIYGIDLNQMEDEDDDRVLNSSR